jgi:hypothetical protein
MFRSMMIAALTLTLGLAGCGGTFRDAAEERAYLSSLANPTPAQWKRLRALDEGPARVVEEGRRVAEAEADRQGREEASATLAFAKGQVGVDDALALRAFRGVIKNHPGSEQAIEAAGRIKALEGK